MIVDGRVVIDEGHAVTIDEAHIIGEARTVLGRVRARNKAVQAVADEVAALE